MRSILLAVPLVVALGAPALRADVTIRYEVKFSSSLRVGSAMMPLPESYVIRLKGATAHTASGHSIELMDFARQEVTLIDTDANK